MSTKLDITSRRQILRASRNEIRALEKKLQRWKREHDQHVRATIAQIEQEKKHEHPMSDRDRKLHNFRVDCYNLFS